MSIAIFNFSKLLSVSYRSYAIPFPACNTRFKFVHVFPTIIVLWVLNANTLHQNRGISLKFSLLLVNINYTEGFHCDISIQECNVPWSNSSPLLLFLIIPFLKKKLTSFIFPFHKLIWSKPLIFTPSLSFFCPPDFHWFPTPNNPPFLHSWH
jgi:hypothetical protein